MLRDAQKTMPMGFTWVISHAHEATRNIIKAAHTITRMSRGGRYLEAGFMFLAQHGAPFALIPGSALALAMIDDISVITTGGTDNQIKLFHRILCTFRTTAGLPIANDKSLEVDAVERRTLPFIFMIIFLRDKCVSPMSNNIFKLAGFLLHQDFT